MNYYTNTNTNIHNNDILRKAMHRVAVYMLIHTRSMEKTMTV